MNEQKIHELALSYAQLKFQEDLKFRKQIPPENRSVASDIEDVHDFLHLYQFAYEHLQDI